MTPIAPVLERGERLRSLAGGGYSLRRHVLPERATTPVKKPVAVPKKWKVPSGKDW
jgi:hypothetical protein